MGREATKKPIALIVEDNQALRKLNLLILSRMGLFGSILEAPDGEVALELARARNPDLILLDLLMPVMDGFEALPLLRAACPNTRIVVFSMARQEGLAQRVKELGADAFVDKSVDEDGLARRIQDLFVPARSKTASSNASEAERA